MNPTAGIRLFSTCPPSTQYGSEFIQKLVEVSQWSEEAGCHGSLIYTDNSLLDPWMVAHLLVQNTSQLAPLVAVQPVYSHPYTVAKSVTSLARLYQRPVFLNMVAGGFKNDLLALGDPTPHDERYERLGEYTAILTGLLRSEQPLTFEGRYYRVKNLSLHPTLPQHLYGGILMSGSSAAGLEAARRAGATAIQYPEPPELRHAPPSGLDSGVRLGIIARPTEDEAWRIALERFPQDRKGQITRTLATQVSDSSWHKQLSGLAEARMEPRSTYWLRPFEHYHTNCPYLVGSYQQVAKELSSYLNLGYRTLILDIPSEAEDFKHIRHVLTEAQAGHLTNTGAVTA